MHIGVETIVPCPKCAAKATEMSVHCILEGRQRFSVSFVCPACGRAHEADSDVPDAGTRELLLEATGAWRLTLESLGPQRARAIRAISDCSKKALIEVSALVRSLPTTLIEGTRIEVEFAALPLERLGVHVSRSRIR